MNLATTRIEYGAHYPFTLESQTNDTINGPVDRAQAESMVNFVNQRLVRFGAEPIAQLIERTVEISDWRPSNTGIVPPYIGEKVEDE